MPAPKNYPDELRDRAVRLVFQLRRERGTTQGVVPGVTSRLGEAGRHRERTTALCCPPSRSWRPRTPSRLAPHIAHSPSSRTRDSSTSPAVAAQPRERLKRLSTLMNKPDGNLNRKDMSCQ